MKTAIVTGASRGIGFAIARRLVREGWSVLAVARDRKRLDHAVSELLSITPVKSEAPEQTRIFPFSADLGNRGSSSEVITECRRRFDHLDLLVNNAGVVASGSIETYSQDDWDRVMNVNARAPFFLMGAALPLFPEKPTQKAGGSVRGRIINIGSVVSRKGYIDQSLYAASKHALLGMTKSAARDLAARGIRVHAILPGGVATDLVRDVRPDIDESELVAPEDVADAVMFLLNQNGNAVVDEIAIRRRTKEAWA